MKDLFNTLSKQIFIYNKIAYNSLCKVWYRSVAAFYLHKASVLEESMCAKSISLCERVGASIHSDQLDTQRIEFFLENVSFHYNVLKERGLLQRQGIAAHYRSQFLDCMKKIKGRVDGDADINENLRHSLDRIYQDVIAADKQHKGWKKILGT